MKRLLLLVTLGAFAAVATGNCRALAARTEGCALGGSAEKTGPVDITARFCGPAVVTLRIAGKTEIFRNGSCFHANGAEGIILYAGTQITHDGVVWNAVSGGVPYIVLRLAAKTHSNVSAYFGDTVVTGDTRGVPITRNPYGVSGSFTGVSPRVGDSLPKNNHPAMPFSGTWNCGGTVLPGDDVVALYLTSLKK